MPKKKEISGSTKSSEDPTLLERVAVLENDVKWVKKSLVKIEGRIWWILGSVVALGVIAILVAIC